jgi:asparagine synthase (glutamine-hydrolysing)
MCGIAGYFQLKDKCAPDYDLIGRMVRQIQHRGPDEFGAYFDEYCALGQARLSIIDLSGGSQPLCNEDGTLWISFNGEIFNYIELRPELEKLVRGTKTVKFEAVDKIEREKSGKHRFSICRVDPEEIARLKRKAGAGS